MYQLFTDTNTDITPKLADELGYKLISMPYSFDGTNEIYPYIDFETFDYKTFYDTLRGGVIPKTFGISPQTYIDYFEPYFKEGKDVIYVHFSSSMSGTFNALNVAREMLQEDYPERNIYTVDTKGVSICSYNIVYEISKLAKANKTIEEILDWANKEVDKFAVYFYADDLNFFAHSGRVSNLSKFFGSMIGIRPIININSDGVMNSITKAKGRKGAIRKILEYVETLQENIKDYKVMIGHADSIELAIELETKLKEIYGDLDTEIHVVNPTIGSHCGPNTVGVCFHAKNR